MSDALERAKGDLLKLQAELARVTATTLDLQRRIVDVSTFIRMFDFYKEEGAEMARSRGGSSALAVQTVIEHLKSSGKAAHTRDLVEMLKQEGFAVGGKDPVANLSGFLSRSPDLMNSRSHGWALTTWGSAAGDPDKAPQVANNVRVRRRPSLIAEQSEPSEEEPEPPEWEPSEPPEPDEEPPETEPAEDDDDIPF